MIQRLHVRIYLTTLASLAIVVLLCALLWRFTAERKFEAQHDRFVAAVVGTALAPAVDAQSAQAALSRLVVSPIEGLVLFDRDGTRVAAAGMLAPSPVDSGPPRHAARLRIHDAVVMRTIPLGDGRKVVARMHSDSLHMHLGGLAMLALIALAVALGTYPVVRRLTRRLEALAASVDRFGQGDLAARVDVGGADELSSLASSFNRMADRVMALLDAHRRMLMNASHELRSPLARVRMALELHESTPREAWLQGMRRDCAEIDDQIEEILLASKLDTVDTVLPEQRVDLEVLLAEESARLGIPFDTVAADVRGDARLLRHLIRNLLENARKHGGGDVAARLVIEGQGTRVLQVSDRGAGIAEAERERIFEPFYRPASAAETGDGWGLGLSLVRQIAGFHHGSIACMPRDGGGCVFELRLPAPASE
jgi:signal transduction histidine kinase